MGKLENVFKQELKKEIEKDILPGSMVLHLDPNERQGIPDLLILYKDRWAILEGKKSNDEKYQPNQEHYIEMFNEWSFSRMICPENKEEVLNDLQRSFEV